MAPPGTTAVVTRPSSAAAFDGSPVDAAAASDPCGPGPCWIDLRAPAAAELDEIATRFDLHELAVEDAKDAHQRPKLERYDDWVVIVARPASYDDASETITIGELLIAAGPEFVVTVRHEGGRAIDAPHSRTHDEHEIEPGAVGRVVHQILDEVVDGYLPIAAELNVDIRQIEADVFTADGGFPTARIYRLKRQVLDLQRNVEPLLGPLDELASGRVDPLADDDTQEYFRDVADHTRRLISDLQHQSDLLSDVLQANLAQLSIKQNEDMRRMSAWAAIFLVPSLLAAIWGMNFEQMPELGHRLGYPAALLAMASVSAILWLQFRRAGWLGGRRPS